MDGWGRAVVLVFGAASPAVVITTSWSSHQRTVMKMKAELLVAAAAALAAARGRSNQMSIPTTMARPPHVSQQQNRAGLVRRCVDRMVTPAW